MGERKHFFLRLLMTWLDRQRLKTLLKVWSDVEKEEKLPERWAGQNWEIANWSFTFLSECIWDDCRAMRWRFKQTYRDYRTCWLKQMSRQKSSIWEACLVGGWVCVCARALDAAEAARLPGRKDAFALYWELLFSCLRLKHLSCYLIWSSQ